MQWKTKTHAQNQDSETLIPYLLMDGVESWVWRVSGLLTVSDIKKCSTLKSLGFVMINFFF